MQIPNNCLQEAMFIASESYSGSSYEASLSQLMGEGCDEIIITVPEGDAANAPAMMAA